jgi:hypothetical protein
MALEDVRKITIIMKVGLFDWNVMPFGMKNVTNIISKMIIEVFGKYIDKFLKMFVDDLNIYIMTWEEHLEHFSFMMFKLREVNLKLNLGKCEFTKTCVRILGHVVNREGQPNQRKIKAIFEFPIPTFVTNVHAFFKLIGYYMNYLKGYSYIFVPFFGLSKKDTTFSWNLVIIMHLIC